MSRMFSVIRRKPDFMHVVIPRSSTVDEYRLKWATNFDQAPTQFLTPRNIGYVDPAIDLRQHAVMAGDNVQLLFKPSTFSIPDTKPFWLQYFPVTGGLEGTPSPMTLILPRYNETQVVVISGLAPNGATVANSLQLDFPRLMSDLRIHNEHATVSLYVAFEPGGYEYQLQAPERTPQLSALVATQPCMLVRGGGGTPTFSATMTFSFAR